MTHQIKIRSLILALVFVFTCCLQAQVTSNVELRPDKIQAGKELTFRYNASNTVLKNAHQVDAVVYSFIHCDWVTSDITLKLDSGYWKGKIMIDPACSLLALKFYNDTLVDTNTNYPYAWLTFTDKGSNTPYSRLAWGLLRTPGSGYELKNYIEYQKAYITDTVLNFWIEQELLKNHEGASNIAMFYARSQNKLHTSVYIEKETKIANFLIKVNTEKSLTEAAQIYRNYVGNIHVSDSITAVVLQRYPFGDLARLTAYRILSKEADANKRRKLAEEFLTNFPLKKENGRFNDENAINYTHVYTNIITPDALKGNFRSYYAYLSGMSLDEFLSVFYKAVELNYKKKVVVVQSLYQPVTKALELIDSITQIKPARYYYLSPLEWQHEANRKLAINTYPTCVEILAQTGHATEALTLGWKTQKELNFKNTDLNEVMARLINNSADKTSLDSLLMKSASTNSLSPYMLELLHQQFKAKNGGSDVGFDLFIDSIKGKKNINVEKFRVNQKMPDWVLEDALGNKIYSKYLIGKNYVIDFWASWCIPCKASFPGMKMALEKYKDANDVVFLFVNTQETNTNYKQNAVKYMKDNSYQFRLLFDTKNKNGKTNDVVYNNITSTFKQSGIPQKIFVNKQGNIQFISIGYNGSPTALVDEVSEMIEATRNSSK